jgi:hypothetical protein
LYYFTPLLLVHSSALFMNLSFLTSDFWSILFAVSLFHSRLNFLYFVAFGIIIIGLLLYNLAGVEGELIDLLKELCTNTAHTDDAEAEQDTASLPTTHAHTRPMVATDGFHIIDQDPTLGTENLQQADQTRGHQH